MAKPALAKKILILAAILALPGFLYYLLTVKGKNRYQPLSIYGPKKLSGTSHTVKGKVIPDTTYHTLSAFDLHDQNGNAVSLSTFKDKIFVAGFFYTRCPTICNEMNRNLDSLATGYSKNKMLRFVSITIDPAHDSEKVLKDYAAKFKAPANWMFLTGDTSQIYPLARKGFLVNALKVDDDNFIYSDKVILIDSHKRIRGYYSGTNPDDMTKLDNEIRVLIAEELRDRDKPMY